MPHERALAVINSAKWPSVPPRASEIATATSLADNTTTALMASSTGMVEPGRRKSFVGAWTAACPETGIGVASVICPFFNCSNRR